MDGYIAPSKPLKRQMVGPGSLRTPALTNAHKAPAT